MSNKIYIDARYGFREDPLEKWETINPVLERGEPSIVRDGKDGKWLKIGDGVTPWNDLPYKLGPVGPQGPKGEDGLGTPTEDGGVFINDACDDVGKNALAINEKTHALGDGSLAKGLGSIAYKPYSSAGGVFSEARHYGADVDGNHLDSARDFHCVRGAYNLPNPYAMFTVGVGTGPNDLKNGFDVLEDGSAEVLTQGETDKSVVQLQHLKKYVKDTTDQTYSPTSENAQSGVAVAEAIGGWEKIVDITTTEEINELYVTVEEFPRISKCKEFLCRVIVPQTAAKVSLGTFTFAYMCDAISWAHSIYRCSLSSSTATASEIRAHGYIIDDLIYGIGCAIGQSSLISSNTNMTVGDTWVSDIEYLRFKVSESAFPIGTHFVIYGKVEG